jgi:hypothetical protein
MIINNKLINQLLQEPDTIENIHVLLQKFISADDKACNQLLQLIPTLASMELDKERKLSDARLKGIEYMIHIYGSKMLTSSQFVVSTVPAVMMYYQQGHCKGASKSGKKFFNKFVKNLIKSQDELIDSDWAIRAVNCNDYLKLVVSNEERRIEENGK